MLPLSGRTALVLLLLTTVSSAALNECPADFVWPQYQLNLSQSSAERLVSTAGSLEPLYNFARVFLQAVQPYALPLDFASRLSLNQASTSKAIGYEAGYVVCLILAILYAVVIPVVGAVLVWRYFHCTNVPTETKVPSSFTWHQWNITVITCLSATVILLLSGVILTFTTNNRMHQNVEPNLSHLKDNFGDIEEALSSVPTKVEFIVDQFSHFHEEMTKELSGTGALIGETILSSLNGEINTTLGNLNITVKDAVGAQRNLQEVKELRATMQANYMSLQLKLQQMRSRLHDLSSSLDTSGLDTDANYTLIPSVDAEVQMLSFASQIELNVQQFEKLISSIPQICTEQTTPKIYAWLVRLNKTQVIFRNYSKQIPSLKSISDTVSDIQASLGNYTDDLQYYDHVRWSVSALLCILLLTISLLMLAGLVIGASVVISPTLYPFHLQDQLRLTAVYLLYVAVGMIFIFSWLFVIMVFLNLFISGNAHGLACRSVANGEIFQYLDKQHYLFSSLDVQDPLFSTPPPTPKTANSTTALILNVTSGPSYQVSDYQRELDIKTYEIYRGCQIGISLFYSMHMNQNFNMDRFLNASMFLTGFSNSMKTLNVQLDNISLLLNTTQASVVQFRDSSNLDHINYNAFQALLARPVVKTDLNAFARQLDIAAISSNDSIRNNLTSEAANARQLAKLVLQQDSYRLQMGSSIKALANISNNYKANANKTIVSSSETERSLRSEVPNIVGDVSWCMMEKGTNLLTQYLDIVRYGIIDQALDCLWLPVSFGNMYTAVCENLIGPWNGFWLSLGWCCAFLIPGLIFSILATQLWKPPPATNKEPFHMPKDIFHKGEPDTDMTLEKMKGKSMKDEHSPKIYNIYMSLEDAMGHGWPNKGKEEK